MVINIKNMVKFGEKIDEGNRENDSERKRGFKELVENLDQQIAGVYTDDIDMQYSFGALNALAGLLKELPATPAEENMVFRGKFVGEISRLLKSLKEACEGCSMDDGSLKNLHDALGTIEKIKELKD